MCSRPCFLLITHSTGELLYSRSPSYHLQTSPHNSAVLQRELYIQLAISFWVCQRYLKINTFFFFLKILGFIHKITLLKATFRLSLLVLFVLRPAIKHLVKLETWTLSLNSSVDFIPLLLEFCLLNVS